MITEPQLTCDVQMWKMITGQAIFQLVVTLILYFAGADILGYDKQDEDGWFDRLHLE